MLSHTRTLRAICVAAPLLLASACRDEKPNPVPPLPPPEIPQQPAPPPQSGASGDTVAPEGTKSSAAPSNAGGQLFATYCVSCHGATGSGDGPLAATLDPKPRNFREGKFRFDTNSDGKTGTLDDLANVIQNGAARYGGSPLMAGFPTLPQPQVRELASYVHELSGNGSGKGG